MSIVLLILGLILFVGLVVVHEFGHFIMARRNGIEVEEFGIGFPPRIWAKKVKDKKGHYEFSINLLPLGGFVRLKGENDSDEEPGSFGAASLKAKVKVMVAGVAMNLVAAFVLLTAVALLGMPKLIDNQYTVTSDTETIRHDILAGYVEPGSPAEMAGIQTRDKLISIGQPGQTQTIGDAGTVPDMTRQYAGEEVEIKYVRDDGEQQTTTATLRTTEEVEKSRDTDEPKGYLGISPSEYIVQRSTWSAPIVAGGLIRQFTVETFKGLGSALSNLFRGNAQKASEQVSGPVGIFVILRDGSLLGYQFILLIVAVISLTLAIMNVLPIPALDGGRLFVTLAFHGIKKPLTKHTEDLIHGTGFALLMVLFLLITVVDVRRFF